VPASPTHDVCPSPHVETQVLATHCEPGPHVAPHEPQLPGSIVVSTHWLPHWVVPPPQLNPHTLCEQTCPALHTVPQPPQFWLSRVVSLQAPPQTTSPALQKLASGNGPVAESSMVQPETPCTATSTNAKNGKASQRFTIVIVLLWPPNTSFMGASNA
jgi:hypothetical protein